MAKAIWKGRLPMHDDLTTKVELEAEDTLAVRLKSLHVTSTKDVTASRDLLSRQCEAVLASASLIEGGLAVLEVDGLSKAVLLRTPKPEEGRYVQVILRGGNSIELDTRGGALFMEREKYEKLTKTFEEILR